MIIVIGLFFFMIHSRYNTQSQLVELRARHALISCSLLASVKLMKMRQSGKWYRESDLLIKPKICYCSITHTCLTKCQLIVIDDVNIISYKDH